MRPNDLNHSLEQTNAVQCSVVLLQHQFSTVHCSFSSVGKLSAVQFRLLVIVNREKCTPIWDLIAQGDHFLPNWELEFFSRSGCHDARTPILV